MPRLGKQQTARPAKNRQRQQPVAISTTPKSVPRQPRVKKSQPVTCPKHVLEKAVHLFNGNTEAAWEWLRWPAPDLGWKTPLEIAQTDSGAEEVIRLITRIEYGTLV